MAGYLEKWHYGFPWRMAPPLPLVLEAGLEVLTLGTAAAIFAAAGVLPLSDSGFVVAAVSYAAVAFFILAGLSRHAPHRHFGPANAITLCRAAFNIVLLTVIAEELLGQGRMLDHAFRWCLTSAAIVALALDGADGWTARRTNMTSEFGARFDMETDGIFLLAMSLLLATSGIVGPWVLASGLIYYVFRLAGNVWPALTASLYPSLRRKAICAMQGAFLIMALAPAIPSWAAQLCCMTGLALLLYSFSVDLAWLLGRPRAS